MAKVMKRAYEWTGEHRPPRKGEWFKDRLWFVVKASFDYTDAYDVYREVQREHEVPDLPVPPWMFDAVHAIAQHADGQRHDLSKKQPECPVCIENAEVLYGHFRRIVAERAKDAAARIVMQGGDMVRAITEVFLK